MMKLSTAIIFGVSATFFGITTNLITHSYVGVFVTEGIYFLFLGLDHWLKPDKVGSREEGKT